MMKHCFFALLILTACSQEPAETTDTRDPITTQRTRYCPGAPSCWRCLMLSVLPVGLITSVTDRR